MNDRDLQAEFQERFGVDFRPQVNPALLAAWRIAADQLSTFEPVLVDGLFRLARPIPDPRDPSRAPAPLQDAGQFFYLFELLRRCHPEGWQDTVRVLLDDFCRLDEQAYQDVFLWGIVELSRFDVRHVEMFWPMVLDLDLTYRAAPWPRPAGVRLTEQPYRMLELLFYFYVLYTRSRGAGRFLSLGTCLLRVAERWSAEQLDLARQVLVDLFQQSHRPIYRDAYGLLRRFG
ncbi:MAG: hypothetical protein ACK4XJ_12635 [Fimbriimonadaceae bacterium]